MIKINNETTKLIYFHKGFVKDRYVDLEIFGVIVRISDA